MLVQTVAAHLEKMLKGKYHLLWPGIIAMLSLPEMSFFLFIGERNEYCSLNCMYFFYIQVRLNIPQSPEKISEETRFTEIR